MVSYSYKDHEYQLSPMHLLVVCWDKRANKPTGFFWALLCIVSFALIHWYFSQGAAAPGSQVLLQAPDERTLAPNTLPEKNPRFRDIHKDEPKQYPEAPKVEKVLQENWDEKEEEARREEEIQREDMIRREEEVRRKEEVARAMADRQKADERQKLDERLEEEEDSNEEGKGWGDIFNELKQERKEEEMKAMRDELYERKKEDIRAQMKAYQNDLRKQVPGERDMKEHPERNKEDVRAEVKENNYDVHKELPGVQDSQLGGNKKNKYLKNPLKNPHFDKAGPNVHQGRAMQFPNPKDFPVRLVHEPELTCGESGFRLIILVDDHAANTGGRFAIRGTWGIQDKERFHEFPPSTWQTIFVMGMSQGSNADFFQEEIDEEVKKYKDILQGDFLDTDYEATRKFMMANKWLYESSKCKTKFVLKTRHDIFLNMHSIAEWLDKRWAPEDQYLYVGRKVQHDFPIRDADNPLFVTYQDYSGSKFPSFIDGPVYLFDWLAYEKLYEYMRAVTPIAMEDAFIGLVAKEAGLTPTDNNHFKMARTPTNLCARLKVFFLHNMLPVNHMDIFKSHKEAITNGKCPDAQILYAKGGNRKPEHFEI